MKGCAAGCWCSTPFMDRGGLKTVFSTGLHFTYVETGPGVFTPTYVDGGPGDDSTQDRRTEA